MTATGNRSFPWSDAEGAFEAWKRCSRGRPCDYSGLSYAKLRAAGSGIQWPCTDQHPDGTERLYADGRFWAPPQDCESYGRDKMRWPTRAQGITDPGVGELMDAAPATRVVLRPLATPLPLGFLALTVSTMVSSAVQLEWVAAAEGQTAALTAVVATLPLQLLASVMGFLARDAVAATGTGVLAGTWGLVAS